MTTKTTGGSTGFVPTPEQDRIARMLVAERCPPGEIADTIGVRAHTVLRLWPDARMTRAERTEWLTLRRRIAEMERGHDVAPKVS